MKEIKSFSCAIKGIFVAIESERHIRLHLVATFYVFFFGILFHLTKAEWCILTLNISAVTSAELFNTAIEQICNMYTKSYNKHIKIIKDISAGGVLVCSLAALLCGITMFGDYKEIALLYSFYKQSPLSLCQLIFTIAASILFVTKASCNNHKFDL